MFNQFFNAFKQFIKPVRKTVAKRFIKPKINYRSRRHTNDVQYGKKVTQNRKRNKVAYRSKRINILIKRGEL